MPKPRTQRCRGLRRPSTQKGTCSRQAYSTLSWNQSHHQTRDNCGRLDFARLVWFSVRRNRTVAGIEIEYVENSSGGSSEDETRSEVLASAHRHRLRLSCLVVMSGAIGFLGGVFAVLAREGRPACKVCSTSAGTRVTAPVGSALRLVVLYPDAITVNGRIVANLHPRPGAGLVVSGDQAFVISDGLGSDLRSGAWKVDLADGNGSFLGNATSLLQSSRLGNIWLVNGLNARELDARTSSFTGPSSPTAGRPVAPVGSGLLTQDARSVLFEVPSNTELVTKVLGEGVALSGAKQVAMWAPGSGEVQFTDPNTGQLLLRLNTVNAVTVATLSPSATRYAIATGASVRVGDLSGSEKQMMLGDVGQILWLNDFELLAFASSGDVFEVNADGGVERFERIADGGLAVALLA